MVVEVEGTDVRRTRLEPKCAATSVQEVRPMDPKVVPRRARR